MAIIIGKSTSDTIAGTAANDEIYGLGGNDLLVGGEGNDTLDGAAGDDTLHGGPGDDVLDGGEGNDRLFGGDGNDDLDGRAGNDMLNGDAGDDALRGGDGNDTLNGGAGADRLIGGDGVDTATYPNPVTINLKTGVHTGEAAGDTFESIEVIQGSSKADTFVGTAGADMFDAGTGKDFSAEYIDTIDYSTSSSAVNVDLMQGTGSGGDAEGDRLIGFERVIGSGFSDTLSSTRGQYHFLQGGDGDDVYVVGSGSPVVVEAANGGDDEVRIGGNTLGGLWENVERLTYTGTGAFTGAGNDMANFITGGPGDDKLYGKGGDDTLRGGAGNDILYGEVGDDVLEGGSGDDTLHGRAGDDRLIGGDGIDTAVFTSRRVSYDISYNTETQTYTVSDLRSESDGRDQVTGVERFQFAGDVVLREALNPKMENRAPTDIVVTGGVITENSPAGTVVATLAGVDPDAGDTATFALVSGATDSFELVGREIRVKAGADIDYEVTRSHELVVAVIDTAGATMKKTITIMVRNAADGGVAGTAGNDRFIGRAEANTFYGGDGIDIVSYIDSDSAITINLITNIHTGDAAGDIFKSIEVFEGTRFGDTFIANTGANTFVGGEGIDIVSYASASAAVLINLATGVHAGDAAGDTFESIEVIEGTRFGDTFIDHAGANAFIGGDGIDSVSYAGASAAVSIDLTSGANGGYAENDRLISIEHVIGSGFGDRLSSSMAGHVMAGGNGNDIYVLGDANVQIIEAGDEGIDAVETALSSVTLGAHLERLTYTGSGAFIGVGNDLDNVLIGGIGNDTLIGLGGADYFVGGGGADRFVGGDGFDIVSYATASAAVSINLATGVHRGDAAGDTFEDIEVIVGSVHDDSFIGNADANIFHGGDGIDSVSYAGASAAVSIDLTAGVNGGDAENDRLIAIEYVIGSNFGDRLSSATAGHVLAGGLGADVYFLGDVDIQIIESVGEGIDVVETALSGVTLGAHLENLTYTGSGAFIGAGNDLDNTIIGGIGNDILIGGGGADRLVGGDGIDIASYASASAAVSVNLATGVHTGDATGDIFESIEVIEGTRFGDTFIGNGGANRFDGGDGVDTISYVSSSAAVNVNLTTNVNLGGDADGDSLVSFEWAIGSSFGDRLSSATAGHVLTGGLGNDVYVLGDANIQIIENGDEGIDAVETTLSSVTLGAHLERLTYTGSSAFIGTGNDLSNVLIGGIGNDTLIGLGGADYFIGGAGADRFIGGDGFDIVSYAGASVAVNINLATGVHTGDAEGDTFEEIEVVLGSKHDDTFVGNAGANAFIGGDGVDIISYVSSSAAVNVNLTTNVNLGGEAAGDSLVSFEHIVGSSFGDRLSSATEGHILEGGFGDDIYVVERSRVLVVEVGGAGIDRVETTLEAYTLSSGVENLTYTGRGAFIGTGNDLDNVLIGGIGNDLLIGGGGADRLIGGDGIDIVSYASASAAVSINLATGAHAGDATGDSFESIEVIIGSDHDDTFIGNAGANVFIGGCGVDTVSYAESNIGITVNLTTGVHGGGAEGDVFRSVEVILGSNANDFFIGDAEANVFNGGAGADTVVFRGKRSDYTITYDGITQTYMLSDRRSGAPDGDDKITGVELFQFADRTLGVDALLSPPNNTPTDILVKGGTIAENSRAGTIVATLAGIDPDADDTMSFSLVAGATDRFELAGNAIRVKTGAVLDFETQSAHELGITVTDTAGATFTKEITIMVSDVLNEGVREGSAKKDIIHGKAVDAFIYGHAGNDILTAGVNGSTLWGGTGDDVISGNCADDRVIGEQGDDTLSGLEGRDTFVFSANEGNDVIYDFNAAEDIIEIHGIPLATSFEQIMANISEADGQTTIDFGDNNRVSLDGMSKWQLTTENFIFA